EALPYVGTTDTLPPGLSVRFPLTVMVPDVSVNGRLGASVAAALTAVLPANVSVPVPPPPPTVWVPVPENTMPPLPALSAMLPAPALRMLPDTVIVAVPLPVWLSDEPASRFSVWN